MTNCLFSDNKICLFAFYVPGDGTVSKTDFFTFWNQASVVTLFLVLKLKLKLYTIYKVVLLQFHFNVLVFLDQINNKEKKNPFFFFKSTFLYFSACLKFYFIVVVANHSITPLQNQKQCLVPELAMTC